MILSHNSHIDQLLFAGSRFDPSKPPESGMALELDFPMMILIYTCC